MKKMKLNFGPGGFQGWLVSHVEKFVLVLFVIVMVWFVVRGSRLEGIKSTQSPDVLKKDAAQAVVYVNQERWDAVKGQPERRFEPNVTGRIESLMEQKTNSDAYRLLAPWNKPLIPKLEKRGDPVVFSPTKLKVVSISGPFSMIPDASDVDPLEQEVKEEDVDPKKPKKPAKKPPTKKPNMGGPGMMPGMPGMDGMPGMPGMPGVPGGGKGKKGKAGAGNGGMPGMPGMAGMAGMAPGMMPGMEGGEEGGAGMGGMGMMPGMPGMAGGPGRAVDSMIIGWRPPQGSTIRIRHANVVMALVPYEKQNEEFDAKLANSLDHDPLRDKPHYLFFAVQRADVTDDPVADPATLDWKSLSVYSSIDDMQTWAGTPKDLMDPAYLMPLYTKQMKGLTEPLPPFVQRNLWEAMTHPDIPLAATAAAAQEVPGAKRPKVKGGEETPDEIPGAGGEGIPGGGMAGMAGMPGMAGGAGMPGMPGMAGGAGMPGMPGMAGGAGMPGMAGGAGMPGMPGMAGGAGMPGMAEGSGGMPGMPGMAGGAGGMPGMQGMPGMGGMYGFDGTEKLVKHKLIRFNDFNVEKGRQYRYRVKVFVEDPNYPSGDYLAPSLAGLDDAARTRVTDLENKDKKSGKKSFYLGSEYSAPSDIVSLPPDQWFYAGKVEPESMGSIGGISDNRKYPNFSRQQMTSALVVIQDEKKSVDVPAKVDLYKGSALNFTPAEVTVIHPSMGDKRKIEKYSFLTNAVVADMRGGEDLPQVDQSQTNPLKAPGEVLFIDAAGNMIVRDEVDDIEYFHRFLGPEEGDKKKKPDDGGMAPGFNGMMPGGAGIPGGAAPPGIPGVP